MTMTRPTYIAIATLTTLLAATAIAALTPMLLRGYSQYLFEFSLLRFGCF